MNDESVISSTTNCTKQESVEEEPFNFLELPRDIQFLICHQFNLSSYTNLMKTSNRVRRLKLTSNTLLFRKHADSVSYHYRPLRVTLTSSDTGKTDVYTWEQLASSPITLDCLTFNIMAPLVDKKFIKLSKLFKENRMKTKNLTLRCRDEAHAENVLNLIDIVKPTILCCETTWPDSFYLDPRMKSVTKIVMYDRGCDEETFLSLTIPKEIRMPGNRLSRYSLSKFFLQLYEGSRSVIRVELEYDHHVFNDFDENEWTTRDNLLPIWTETTHHLSHFKDYPLSQMQLWYMGKLFYLFPCDSKGLEYYSVEFNRRSVMVEKTSYIFFGILSNLPWRIASKVLNMCLYCRKTYCDHRHEWCKTSIQEKYPIAYNCFMNCLSVAEVVVTCLCFNSTIVQANWFHKKRGYGYTNLFCISIYFENRIVTNVLDMM